MLRARARMIARIGRAALFSIAFIFGGAAAGQPLTPNFPAACPDADRMAAAEYRGDFRAVLTLARESVASAGVPARAACRAAAGYASYLLGDYRAAERELTAAREGGAGAMAHEYLALLQRKLGRYREATESLRAISGPAGGAVTEPERLRRAALAASLAQYLGRLAEAGRTYNAVLEDLAAVPLDPLIRARILNDEAIYRYAAGDYRGAAASSRRARDTLAAGPGAGHPEAGESLNNLAAADAALGRIAEAEAGYRAAAELRTRTLGRKHPDYATTLNNLAVLLAQQGRAAESHRLLTEVLSVRETALGADHPFTAATLDNLSYALRTLGRYGEALQQANRAATITRKALGPDHPEYAIGLRNRGELAQALGRSAEAERYLREALRILTKAFPQSHPEAVTTRQALGSLLLTRGERGAAEAVLRQALRDSEQSLGGRHPTTAAVAASLGALLVERGSMREAEALLRRALDVWQAELGADHPHNASALNNLARLLAGERRAAEAEPLLRRALAITRSRGVSSERVEVAANLASVLQAQRQYPAALDLYEEAVDTLDALYRNTALLSEDIRHAFVGRFARVYRDYLDLLLELHRAPQGAGYGPRIVEVLARNQSRIFSELMVQAGLERELSDPRLRALLDEQREATLRLNRVETERLQMTHGDGAGLERRGAVLEREQSALNRRLEEIEQTIRRNHGDYAELIAPPPVRATEIQAVLAPEEVVIAYALLGRSAAMVVLTRSGLSVHPITAPAGSIRDIVRQIHQVMAASHGLRSLRELDPRQLHELHRELLEPAKEALKGTRRIIVVADGPLFTLPFEMLVSSWSREDEARFDRARKASLAGRVPALTEYAELSYAARDHEFLYYPSLAALRAERGRKSPVPSYTHQLIAFADPVFAPGHMPIAYRSEDQGIGFEAAPAGATERGRPAGLTFPPLPNTALEARNAARILGGRSEVLLREQAREARARSMPLEGARYLLFATHGVLGMDFRIPGAQPSLVLTQTGLEPGEDGFLTMGEVLNLRLGAQLVALSACKTAGDFEAALGGEGFAGLTRAFMYAGARRVMVSHWLVETHAAQRMVELTFEGLKARREPPQALQRASEHLRRSSFEVSGVPVSTAHPFFWAPFVLVGG